MRRQTVLIAAVAAMLVVPAAAGAQAGVPRRDPLASLPGEMEPPSMPDAKAMEKATPAAVLLDKKKKLALSDVQLAALTALRKATADSNARNYVVWDSVRTDLLIAGKSPTVDPADMQRWRRTIQTLYQGLRARNQWARAEATKLLTDEQRPKATEFWDDEDEQAQKWLTPRRRGGGGGGGRRPPTGGRPSAT